MNQRFVQGITILETHTQTLAQAQLRQYWMRVLLLDCINRSLTPNEYNRVKKRIKDLWPVDENTWIVGVQVRDILKGVRPKVGAIPLHLLQRKDAELLRDTAKNMGSERLGNIIELITGLSVLGFTGYKAYEAITAPEKVALQSETQRLNKEIQTLTNETNKTITKLQQENKTLLDDKKRNNDIRLSLQSQLSKSNILRDTQKKDLRKLQSQLKQLQQQILELQQQKLKLQKLIKDLQEQLQQQQQQQQLQQQQSPQQQQQQQQPLQFESLGIYDPELFSSVSTEDSDVEMKDV